MKTLLIMYAITILLIVAFYVVDERITFGSIAAAESEEASASADRFLKNLNLAVEELDSTADDWGAWDDTYQFAYDNNTAYVENNLMDQTFVNLKLNMMLFFDESRQLIFAKMFDLNSETAVAPSADFLKQVASNDALFTNDPAEDENGLILVDETPMLTASHPILNSMDEGPARGSLIIGQSLNEERLGVLAEAVGIPISIQVLEQPRATTDFQVAAAHLSSSEPIFTQALNETTMSGYALLHDVTGAPILMARVDNYRAAYAQGKSSMLYTGLSLNALGVVIFVMLAFLLDKVVISRLTKLGESVASIRKTSDYSKRVAVRGHDELSSLSENINGMLDVIEKHAVTLEKTVEERTRDLRENQEKLRSILSASPDAILATDAEGKITECNQQMTRLCGSDRGELLGKHALDYFAEKDRQKVFEQLAAAAFMQDGSILHLEYYLYKKNGERYPAELSISVMRDMQNSPVGFVAVVRDLTEKKQLEQRLFKSERMAAIGELAGMVGHDLRNPLTAIKSADYMLRKKCTNCGQSDANSMFEIIDKSIDHANRVVNDLLDYSREINLEVRMHSPKSLLQEAISMVRIPEKITVSNQASTEARIAADGNKLVRVFVNLISNAVDAMPDGGTLEILSARERDFVVITFADTGVGIRPDVMPKIFTPLFTTKAQGMGFGLSICKRIVEAHKGRITIESQVAKGTKVAVKLPIDPALENHSDGEWLIRQEPSLLTTAREQGALSSKL
ncbi:MAG: CHASE4 domain-containing protein [Candidatus Bathyarchaeia archaeon]